MFANYLSWPFVLESRPNIFRTSYHSRTVFWAMMKIAVMLVDREALVGHLYHILSSCWFGEYNKDTNWWRFPYETKETKTRSPKTKNFKIFQKTNQNSSNFLRFWFLLFGGLPSVLYTKHQSLYIQQKKSYNSWSQRSLCSEMVSSSMQHCYIQNVSSK